MRPLTSRILAGWRGVVIYRYVAMAAPMMNKTTAAMMTRFPLRVPVGAKRCSVVFASGFITMRISYPSRVVATNFNDRIPYIHVCLVKSIFGGYNDRAWRVKQKPER